MVRIGLYVLHFEGPGEYREQLSRCNLTTDKPEPYVVRREIEYWRKRCIVDVETGCWLFQGAMDKDGYGQARRNGVLVQAHRGAWTSINGPIGEGMVLMHSCDTPACCNPDHLSLGTQADNMADMAAKGRSASGSRNGRAKLSDEERESIRLSDEPDAVLAELYGVVERTIARVRTP